MIVCYHSTKFAYSENKESQLFAGIGKEIVKECDGLPLAAKTLGSPMQYMKTKEEWQNIRHIEIRIS